MKIAVVSANSPSLFGIRSELIQEFISRGHEVVAIGGGSEADWEKKAAERGHGYRQFFVNRVGTNPLQDIATLKSLERIFADEKPDKIFAYHAKGNVYGSMAAHRVCNADIYCLVAGLGSVFRDNADSFNPIRTIMSLVYKVALRYPKAVFFQNSDDLEVFSEMGIVDPQKTVIVNGSGVDIDRFPLSPLPDAPSFLFVGRLIKDKGIREFVEAARIIKSKYPEAQFNVLGGIDANPTSLTLDEVDEIAAEGAIVFHGEHSDVVPFYQENSVFVLPSYHEGTPRSALEALSVGRPVILTDAPGCRDVVTDGVNGLMIPVGNPDALADAMEKLILNPEMRAQMGKKSRAIAEEKYDVRKVNAMICTTMNL